MTKKIIFVVIGLTLVVALGFWWKLKNTQTTYQLVQVKQGPVVESVFGLGTVVAPNTFQYKSGVPLHLRKVWVQEGDSVKKGDSLLSFDDVTIKSPLNGTVTSIPYREGELVFPQQAAITVVSPENLYLEVSLEQQTVLRIKNQNIVRVAFESLRGERFEGKVASVYSRQNQFIVRIEVPTLPPSVLPGMTADVAIETGRKDQAILVPVRAVADGFVMLNVDGHKTKTAIKLGVVDGEWAEVLEGVRADQGVWVPSEKL